MRGAVIGFCLVGFDFFGIASAGPGIQFEVAIKVAH